VHIIEEKISKATGDSAVRVIFFIRNMHEENY